MAKKRLDSDLKAALRAAGSQAALGRAIGRSPDTIRRWLRGTVPADARELLQAFASLRQGAPKPPRAERGPEALRRALRAVPVAKKLAAELGVSPSTLRRWRKQGPSEAGRQRLVAFNATQREFQQARKTERERLHELLGFAGQLDKIPSFTRRSQPRSGERTQGWRYDERWGRELTEGLIDQIVRWVETLRVRFGLWHGIVRMLHYEPENAREFKRSGPNIVMDLGERVSDALIDATLTTKRRGSRRQLAGEIRGMLEDVLEQGFYAYILGTSVINYRMRTEEERLQWLRTKALRLRFKKQETKKRTSKKAPKKAPKQRSTKRRPPTPKSRRS